jgi:hypothetical protein
VIEEQMSSENLLGKALEHYGSNNRVVEQTEKLQGVTSCLFESIVDINFYQNN